jgi:hypothetical protein
LPLRSIHEGRQPSVRALLLGHIRLGVYAGGRPQESATLIFTSSDPDRLKPLAEDFGGEVERYKPQGAGGEEWRLQSETDRITALFPFPDLDRNVQQDFELWGRGGLKRRCDGFEATLIHVDGETGEITEEQAPCICQEKNKQECAATTRLNLLLPQTGLGVWQLRTGSKIAARDLWDQVGLVATLAKDRMNLVPVRIVWAPREIKYWDEKEGKQRTTTKRVVSLSVAGDAQRALTPLGLRPDRGLIHAVRSALEDAGRELSLPAPTVRPELEAGNSSEEEAVVSSDEVPENIAAHDAPTDPSSEPPEVVSRQSTEKAVGTPRGDRFGTALKSAVDAGMDPADIQKSLVRVCKKKKWKWSGSDWTAYSEEELAVFAEALEADVAAIQQQELGVGS